MQNPQYNVFGQGTGVQTMGKFAPDDLEHSAAAVKSVAAGKDVALIGLYATSKTLAELPITRTWVPRGAG